LGRKNTKLNNIFLDFVKNPHWIVHHISREIKGLGLGYPLLVSCNILQYFRCIWPIHEENITLVDWFRTRIRFWVQAIDTYFYLFMKLYMLYWRHFIPLSHYSGVLLRYRSYWIDPIMMRMTEYWYLLRWMSIFLHCYFQLISLKNRYYYRYAL
jgi:hypothetical protein